MGRLISGLPTEEFIGAQAYAYFDNEEDIVHAAKTAMFTHREATALAGAACVIHMCLDTSDDCLSADRRCRCAAEVGSSSVG